MIQVRLRFPVKFSDLSTNLCCRSRKIDETNALAEVEAGFGRRVSFSRRSSRRSPVKRTASLVIFAVTCHPFDFACSQTVFSRARDMYFIKVNFMTFWLGIAVMSFSFYLLLEDRAFAAKYGINMEEDIHRRTARIRAQNKLREERAKQLQTSSSSWEISELLYPHSKNYMMYRADTRLLWLFKCYNIMLICVEHHS